MLYTGNALQKDLVTLIDLMQEVMDRVGDDNKDSIADEMDDLKDKKELYRLYSTWEAYIQIASTMAKIGCLVDTTVPLQEDEKADLKALRELTGKLEYVGNTWRYPDLTTLIKEARDLERKISTKVSEISEAPAKAAPPTSTKPAGPTVPYRASTITMTLPTFDGKIANWRNFWGLFSNRLDHELG